MKPILATLKADFRKEAEQTVLFDSLQKLNTQISGQNVDNMNKYTENMMTLVTSIKDTFTKDEAAGVSTAGVGSKVTKLTKPAKVLSWSKDMTLETYAKQLQTWTDMLEYIPEFIKCQDLVESLKNNKEIKGLSRYVREHVLPVLEKKTDMTMKCVLDLLDIKYGHTRTEKIEEVVEDWMKFKQDQFKEDRKFILSMKEINQ